MKRVLIVDDDRDITEALGELLEDQYEVRLAFDGSEALRILLDEDVDVMVLDLMMPTSGETLIGELKARGMEVPVIFASSATNLRERAQHSGATDFISKPFELKKLEDKLARILDGGSAGGAPPRGGGPAPSKASEGSDRRALPPTHHHHPVPVSRPSPRAFASAPSACRDARLRRPAFPN